MNTKTLFLIGMVEILLIPGAALAQSNFSGAWRIEINKTSFSGNPEILVLNQGEYQCKSCVPNIAAKADGTDHSVTGNPYFDTISIKVVDDRTVEETRKKNGRTVSASRIAVSADGNSATFQLSDSSRTNGDPIVVSGTLTRVGKQKRSSGRHILSGEWQKSKYANLSEAASTFTLEVDGDTVRMTTPAGQSYAPSFNGSDAPYHGDVGVTSVSVLRLGKDTFTETDKRDGKAIRERRFMVNPNDAKTMVIIDSDSLTGSTEDLNADKQ